MAIKLCLNNNYNICHVFTAEKTGEEAKLLSEEDRAKWENSFHFTFLHDILNVSAIYACFSCMLCI